MIASAVTTLGMPQQASPQRTPAFKATEAALAAALLYEAANSFKHVNRAADRVEDAMPQALHYNTWGDPISWLHHGMWTAGGAGLGALLAKATGTPAKVGAADFAKAMLAMYLVREGVSALGGHDPALGPLRDKREQPSYRHGIHVGWAVDGLMDLVAPAGVNIMLR